MTVDNQKDVNRRAVFVREPQNDAEFKASVGERGDVIKEGTEYISGQDRKVYRIKLDRDPKQTPKWFRAYRLEIYDRP
jgi:hypothetical protein